jgi:hypothetical protein
MISEEKVTNLADICSNRRCEPGERAVQAAAAELGDAARAVHQHQGTEVCAVFQQCRGPSLTTRLTITFGVCRVCVGTWNAAGEAPPSDLDITDWIGTGGDAEPADIYVLG